MSLGFGAEAPHPAGRRQHADSRVTPSSRVRHDPVWRVDGGTDGPSRREIAVEKVAGLLALATGGGLLAPLVFAIQRDEADGVGAAIIAVLSGITLVAGGVLLRGTRFDTEEREQFD